MSPGKYRPTHRVLGRVGAAVSYAALRVFASRKSFLTASSRYARERSAALTDKIRRGETAWLLGIGPAGHNSGVALVEVSADRGVNLIRNNEEERYTGIKNCTAYPEQSLNALMEIAAKMGIGPRNIHACVASWDYVRLGATLAGAVCSELPASRILIDPAQSSVLNLLHIFQSLDAPARLGRQLGLPGPMPIVGMRHHGNHAYFSFAVSPFAASREPVLIVVMDGIGDDGAISIYLAQDGVPRLVYRNREIFDSLGLFYGFISSTQGGWTLLSSEGRYMGAVAWGDNDRTTNPYYRGLRDIFHLGPNGEVRLNRALANWPRRLWAEPYTKALIAILGEPIPLSAMWNPDAVLKLDASGEPSSTSERFDKAAATQMVFEDALFHVIDHHIRVTGASRLVLTGGTALNALANMRLMEHFDEGWYQRNLGKSDTCLHLWVPPVPGDAGVSAGAAYQFAMLAGAQPGLPLRHAFYCGSAPTNREIEAALNTSKEIAWQFIGSVVSSAERDRVADFLASCIASDGVLGLFQGVAETGPRALGHRSILANPCNPRSLETINRSVKFREPFRPLAPMATLDAAQRFWFLRKGALDDDATAYSYMVITARPKPGTERMIPAVVHRDDTSRIQIVRPDTDSFTHAYLRAMGRRVGAEVSVNTSLNVAGPIVQTPEQALEALRRARAMDGLLLIGEEGGAYLAWHAVATAPKDGGRRLTNWLARWREVVETV